jgi:hypothetical protein
MQQTKAAQQFKKSTKQKNDNHKRSRGHSLTGTVSNQLLNYAKLDQLPRAEEQSNPKIKKQKIHRVIVAAVMRLNIDCLKANQANWRERGSLQS